MPSARDIAIVIATRDRRAQLLRTLRRLADLDEATPVIVVDDGSLDGTAEAVRAAFPQVDVVRLPEDRGAAARNVGVQRASARYVAFLDDDSWWAPGALARAVEVLDAHPQLGVLAARVLVGDDERLDPVCALMEHSPLTDAPAAPGRAVLGFVACGAVVRRDAFLGVGGFDEHYGIGGEEAALAVRLASEGWELRYVPDVVAHHHPHASAGRAGRAARVLRNDLWTTWSSRPAREALSASARLVRAAGPRQATVAGVVGALRGLGRVLRHRRRASPAVAAQLRLVEAQTRGGARGRSGEA